MLNICYKHSISVILVKNLGISEWILKFQCLFLYVLLPTDEGYKGEGIVGVVIIVQCFEALPLVDL